LTRDAAEALGSRVGGLVIRAVVFDFDGLILDTEGPVFNSWRELYEAHGLDLPFDRWVGIIGSSNATFHPQAYLEERLGRPLTQELVDRRIARRAELVLAQSILPGVVELAEGARQAGLKVGVASSSSRDWVGGHLERLGIRDRFDCVRSRDDVEHVKPEPDLYLSVAGCLGVRPEEAVAVEDSPNGIEAAKRAGMRCVAVPNPITAGLDLSQADVLVPSLGGINLAQMLARLGLEQGGPSL